MPSPDKSPSPQKRPGLLKVVKGLFKTAAKQEKPDAATSIPEAASRVGVTLQPERLAFLVKYANTPPEAKRSGEAFFGQGLSVTDPRSSDHGTRARIDFAPWGADTPQTEYANDVATMGLLSLQHYLLLVDAGQLEKPDTLYGTTNLNMGKAAERFGFPIEQRGQYAVTEAPYQQVHDAVFSPRNIAFAERLYKHALAMRDS